MCYHTQMPFIFVTLFSDIGQCYQPAQTMSLENQKAATDKLDIGQCYRPAQTMSLENQKAATDKLG